MEFSNDIFQQGFLLGKRMSNNENSLKPVVYLPLDGDLTNKGSYKKANIVPTGSITYTNGRNDKKCLVSYRNKIQIKGIGELLKSDFTVCCWFLAYLDNAQLSSYRRLLASSDGKTISLELNEANLSIPYKALVLGGNGTSVNTDFPAHTSNDSTWRFASFTYRKNVDISSFYSTASGATVKNATIINNTPTTSPTYIDISHETYSLNGLIQDFKIFNRALSVQELEQVRAESYGGTNL